MTPLEQQEVRGISLKMFFTIIVSVVTLFVSGAVWYATNKAIAEDNSKRLNIIEMKVETINVNLQKQAIWQARIEEILKNKNLSNGAD